MTSNRTEDQRTAFRELVRKAGEHTPIAYLLGSREFFSLEFQVTPAVLVPRPETEALAQRMIDLCRASAERQWHILDLGTGSGCVAVTIAKYAANAILVASDISEEALAVARANIERHGLGGRIRAVLADGFALPADCIPKGGFDAVVSNPPYISEAVYKGLPPNVRDHEPRVALVPPGSTGCRCTAASRRRLRQCWPPAGDCWPRSGTTSWPPYARSSSPPADGTSSAPIATRPIHMSGWWSSSCGRPCWPTQPEVSTGGFPFQDPAR